MKKKKSKKSGAIDRISEILEIPPILSGNSVHIELMDSKEAIVDGVSGVILYDDSIIRLAAGRREIKFLGQNLELRTLSTQEAVVIGDILSLEFE